MVGSSEKGIEMITPEYLDEVVEATKEKVAEVNEYIIVKIADRIMASFKNNNGELMIPATRKNIVQLMNAGMVYQEVERELTKRLPEIEEEVKKAFADAKEEIMKEFDYMTETIIEWEKGHPSIPKHELEEIEAARRHGMTKQELQQLETAYNQTHGTIYNLTKTTAAQVQRDYILACDNAFMQVKRGISLDTAVIDAIKEMSAKGIRTVTYGSRVESIEVAIVRAVRTGINMANASAILTRCAEMGVDAVKVSSHMGARVTNTNDYKDHSKWQGKIYRLDYSKPALSKYKDSEIDKKMSWIKKLKRIIKNLKLKKYPDFVKVCGYGKALGICGINCRHTFSAFYPGMQKDKIDSVDEEENKKRYKQTQKQRALEREIRKQKRLVAALKEDTSEEGKKAMKEEKKRLRTMAAGYHEYCEDNNLSPSTMRLTV